MYLHSPQTPKRDCARMLVALAQQMPSFLFYFGFALSCCRYVPSFDYSIFGKPTLPTRACASVCCELSEALGGKAPRFPVQQWQQFNTLQYYYHPFVRLRIAFPARHCTALHPERGTAQITSFSLQITQTPCRLKSCMRAFLCCCCFPITFYPSVGRL